MSLLERKGYEFGAFRLEPEERLLSRNGVAVPLTPKAFDVLVALVLHAGHVVKKEDLLREVWPDTFVEEANLSYTVSLLRKALESTEDDRRYIDTVQKLGYRFAVSVRTQGEVEGRSPAALEPQNGSAPTRPQTTAVDAGARRGRRPWRDLAAAAVAAMVATMSIIALQMRPATQHVAMRLDIALPPYLYVQEGKEPTISPDGRSLAITGIFDGKPRLVVRQLDSPTLVPIAGADGGWLPVWSPDSRAIAFVHGTTLKKVDIAGGSVVDLCEVGFPAGGDWNSADVILFGSGQSGRIHRTLASGGACEAVTTLDVARGETAHRWPNFLPDGRHFLYSADGREGGLYAAALDSKDRKRILADGGRGAHYVAPGYLLFLRRSTLMAQRFDARALEARGDAFPLVDNVGLGSAIGTGFSVARSGSIIYRPVTHDASQLFWFTRDGSRLGSIGPAGAYRQVALAPSGRQAALTRRDPVTGGFDLWLLDVATGALQPLTSNPEFILNDDPVWSPDERTLAFQSRSTTGQGRLFTSDLITRTRQGLGEAMSLDGWTSDGQFVIARRLSEQGITVYALSSTGARKPLVLTAAPYILDQLQVSPDGKWVAFNADESGRFEVYVARFPQFTERRQISIAGGVQPLWRRDGRELFYLTVQGVLMSAAFHPDSPSDRTIPRPLFDTTLHPDPGLGEYAVTADGQRFLVVQRKTQTITILMNWLEGHESN
jgi:DNA-binding winged helix-turn-helix (wHTH) protein/Tol biopolymer transport system component